MDGVRNTALNTRHGGNLLIRRLHCIPAAARRLFGRKPFSRRLFWSIPAAVVIITQAGCGQIQPHGKAEEPVARESFYFDTICQITIYGIRQSDASSGAGREEGASFSVKAESAIADAFSLCDEYEKLLSKTKEGSDIWNINHAEGDPVSCDARTIDVLEEGIAYGKLSGGKFDITVGKAEDLWDFHGESPKVPDSKLLSEAVRHVDYRNIQIDADQKTVSLKDPETEIDLGGIAKGYIADRVCEKLRAEGVTSAIVSLGGNIECIGGKPDSAGNTTEETVFSPFTIGIETPYSDRKEIVGSSLLMDGTMVTSGVYERFFTENGKEYHHILDVKTGYPADSDVLGVTIKGEKGTSGDCDALSTTCLILGSEEGKKLIEGMDGYEALFLLRDGSVKMTSGMQFTPAG